MTLREVCGLTTEEIAAAFLATAPTIAQRIVRAKARIREARIPYETPARNELPERLEYVLRAVYLVFNEGYSASSGASVTRPDLSAEAIRLGRLLVALLPDPEAIGLLALMLLQESRRAARADAAGDLILLEDQDRTRWDRALIGEGLALVERAFAAGEVGSYAIQAAIAAEHARAPSSATDTDWARIVVALRPAAARRASPVVELNRAAAIAERDGPQAGPRTDRSDPRARRPRRLSPRARGARRTLPPARPVRRSRRRLRPRIVAHPPGAGTEIPGAAEAGTGGVAAPTTTALYVAPSSSVPPDISPGKRGEIGRHRRLCQS